MVAGEFLAVLKLHHLRRPISLGLALVFVTALAVASFHHATEIHGYCSEHGVRIHLDHPTHEHSLCGRSALHHEPEHARGVHDCSFLLFLAQGQELHLAATGAAEYTVDLDADADRHWASATTISLLSQSPKTSPPRG